MILITQAISDFIVHCRFEKNLTSHTIKAYKLDLNQFKIFVSIEKNVSKINLIDKIVLREYLNLLLNKYKVKSVKRKIATLKALFNFLLFEDIIIINPFQKMRIKLKAPFILPRTITMPEIKSLLNTIYILKETSIDNKSHKYKTIIRDITILELLFATGIRVSELCNLTNPDVDMIQGIIRVKGKGNKERIIQICSDEITKIMKHYFNLFHSKENNPDFFFINRLGKRFSEQSVRFMIKKYVNITKIDKHITPHMFRHTFATMLLEEGVDIRYIQQFLGHSSIMTTQIYTHVTREKQKEILSTKHPRTMFCLVKK